MGIRMIAKAPRNVKQDIPPMTAPIRDLCRITIGTLRIVPANDPTAEIKRMLKSRAA